MEEDDVKSKFPEIYTSIIKFEEEIDWAKVKEDLEDLNWLDFEIADLHRHGSLRVESSRSVGSLLAPVVPRFKILKVTKVKLPVTNSCTASAIIRKSDKSAGKVEERSKKCYFSPAPKACSMPPAKKCSRTWPCAFTKFTRSSKEFSRPS